MISKLWHKLTKQGARSGEDLLPSGFHGDRYLIEIAEHALAKADTFIETGTNVSSTLAYVAKRFPELECYSCEPDKEACAKARRHTRSKDNVHLFCEDSDSFMQRIDREHSELFKKKTVFWLDAHGWGFDWPLRREMGWVTSKFTRGRIFIDDFLVPGRPEFKYDVYEDQECSFEYIREHLSSNHKYTIYYPKYSEHTSSFHPLTGWGLIEFGFDTPLVDFIDPDTVEVSTHGVA